jgi:hypothetical protein
VVRGRPRRVIIWIIAAIRRLVVEQVGAEVADEGFEFVTAHLVQRVHGVGQPAHLAGAGAVAVHAERQPDEPAGRFALVADAVLGSQVVAKREADFGEAFAQDDAASDAVQPAPEFRVVVGPAADRFGGFAEVEGDGLPGSAVRPQVGGFGEEFIGRRLVRAHGTPRPIRPAPGMCKFV